ncbi:hypothetical protein CPAV1605_1433 [seawater metagenome]|uniref:Uncharacterized protein n=1 Tax=seawater metagenome TaxID=1561972 RepID=A0A5E8CK20_9ZZZZ
MEILNDNRVILYSLKDKIIYKEDGEIINEYNHLVPIGCIH